MLITTLPRSFSHWEDGTPVRTYHLFPGCYEKIFASWFTGTIKCGQGELLNYVHMGFNSTYERDLMLEFEDGVLVDTHFRDNTIPERQSKKWSWKEFFLGTLEAALEMMGLISGQALIPNNIGQLERDFSATATWASANGAFLPLGDHAAATCTRS